VAALPDDARGLSDDEAGVLELLLQADFPGAVELRVQAAHLLAARGCTCPCGSIDLFVTDPAAPRAFTVDHTPAEGSFDAGQVGPCSVVLFVRDGVLDRLEVVYYDDPPPMPSPEQITSISVRRA
jgi:hypothetical protein